MDTMAESTVITTSDSLGKEINQNIKDICGEVEGRISNTIETGEIFKINEFLKTTDHTSAYPISKETADLLNLAQYMRTQTNGAFNPSLGEIIDLWDINDPNPDAVHKLPEKNAFDVALAKIQTPFSLYEIYQNSDEYSIAGNIPKSPKIDLGGIGKGYALDCIDDYLVGEQSLQNALVSFSSSVLALGKNKSGDLWTIGIKDPVNPDKICGYVSATDKVISVSGGYERYITIIDDKTGKSKNYCHIIDPDTGYPVDNDLLCVVVVMSAKSIKQSVDIQDRYKNSGAISDALSTALYVMGKDKAIEFYNKVDYKNNPQMDFDMILFVKNDSVPRGYDILTLNVMFTEIDESSQS
ncbi:MAG: FAD:protein FMN transferase [Oscillospiraceae bacterium]|nr:FAD:protein FMN transferase [Oscillospiraceae bacterium]